MKTAVSVSIGLGLLAGLLWPLQGIRVQALQAPQAPQLTNSSQELARLMGVVSAVKRYSLQPVTEAALLEAASAGLVNALDDP
jgi:hypothetical protein